jgi:hypothetical protein
MIVVHGVVTDRRTVWKKMEEMLHRTIDNEVNDLD